MGQGWGGTASRSRGSPFSVTPQTGLKKSLPTQIPNSTFRDAVQALGTLMARLQTPRRLVAPRTWDQKSVGINRRPTVTSLLPSKTGDVSVTHLAAPIYSARCNTYHRNERDGTPSKGLRGHVLYSNLVPMYLKHCSVMYCMLTLLLYGRVLYVVVLYRALYRCQELLRWHKWHFLGWAGGMKYVLFLCLTDDITTTI